MKLLRLLLPALALVVAGALATDAMACEKHKSAQASSAMAEAATAEVAGATDAKDASAASSDHCASAKATTASAPAKGKATAAKAGHSCGTKTSATTAGFAGKDKKVSAVAAGSQCGNHGAAKTTARAGHGDCDACADIALCSAELDAVSARTQVVPLKNGVMFVYIAENPGEVSAVQSALARRGERLTQFVTAGDKLRLCAECKTMRGAMASGKLTREVVNIEGGALTLMTSSDPKIVASIHAMVGTDKVVRTKS